MQAQYEIVYLDMYDYGSSWSGGRYNTASEALTHAHKVIDDFLSAEFKQGKSAQDLYEQWMMFGEDVLIVAHGGAEEVAFKGQEYARARAAAICAGRVATDR